jgi:uncharacterized protein YciI
MMGKGQVANNVFDQHLADSLGADELGMKNYVLVILKTGDMDAKITDKAIRDSLFAGHFNNMGKMEKAGKLIIAGPFGKNQHSFRGLFILNVKTIEEAEALSKTDPAVNAGIFKVELYPWYGSAALPMYLPYAGKVAKKEIN